MPTLEYVALSTLEATHSQGTWLPVPLNALLSFPHTFSTAILRSSSLEHPHYFSSTAQALNILYDQDSALSKVITDHSGHWPLFLPLGCQELTTRATVTTGLLGSHVTFSQNPSQSLTQFLVRRWSQKVLNWLKNVDKNEFLDPRE